MGGRPPRSGTTARWGRSFSIRSRGTIPAGKKRGQERCSEPGITTGFALDKETSAGTSANFLVDSRDSSINPSRGYYADLKYQMFFEGFLGEKLFDSFATAGGAGLRVKLSKRSRTNLCVDFGWGEQGSNGVYFSVQEAF